MDVFSFLNMNQFIDLIRRREGVKIMTDTRKSLLIDMKKMGYISLALIISCFLGSGAYAQDKPNILVIMGDDVGWFNLSHYQLIHMGY